ncbi:hypothetical protein OIU77_022493 [Salix suchowensis]|uniref:Uncharacterized protein n=1 Tax=Salix suchowensis TaxID=1278906 RepID=A0ABQ9C3H9_9ROSI|nr:hypothetical protein OIU77_022493 [Salix suchowensis]
MGSDATGNGSAKSGGFKSRVQRYLYSGDTKHVMAGMAIITLAFGVPWLIESPEFPDYRCHLRLKMFFLHCIVSRNHEQSTRLIKITWKRQIKQGVTDFLQVLQLHDFVSAFFKVREWICICVIRCHVQMFMR